MYDATPEFVGHPGVSPLFDGSEVVFATASVAYSIFWTTAERSANPDV
jgi:hypothetical protein